MLSLPPRRPPKDPAVTFSGANHVFNNPRRELFNAGGVVVGTFRCSPNHPLHRDSGPIRHFVVVFPRTAGSIQHEGCKPFFASPLVAPMYNRGQRYVRCNDNPHNTQGDLSDWVAISDSEMILDIVREFDPWVQDRPDRPFRFPFAPASAELYGRQRVLLSSLASGEPLEPAAVQEVVIGLVREVLAAVHGAPSDVQEQMADSRHFAAARLEVLRSFCEPLSLRVLAERVGVSVPHLSRLFRAHAGKSVHQMVIELRLRASLDALRDPRVDVSALAADLGFSSHSHFTAAFRRAFGQTPSAMRGRISRQGTEAWLGRSEKLPLRRTAWS